MGAARKTTSARIAHLVLRSFAMVFRQYKTRIGGETANREMRQIGQDARRQIEIEHAVDEDAEIEITAAGEEPQHAVEEIERAEQLEVGDARPCRDQGGDAGP